MTTSSDLKRVKDIFNDALELHASERPPFLDQACAGDAALRAQVEALLAAAEGTRALLGRPDDDGPEAREAAGAGGAALREGPGTRIGRYKLLEQVGEGGFGVVFMAEQEQPVRRRVALKIVKLGMDTRQVVARFESERQALALMDHPNIAKVHDGGSTDSGRPYFVMELVRGVPITEYCDAHRLTARQRLVLFRQVCHAVQHAHAKGIIHRDIKPSNVLVTEQDGRPVPKVIDFGIAKATDQRLTEKTVFTEFRQMLGTPQYMSPEQAEVTGADVDTRSDVYSLGVLLYELLVGDTPFDARELRSKAYGEVQRIIREGEPRRPSTRLSTLGGRLATVASRRQTDGARLVKMVRGELDWVVMKCLERDRERRYQTANALASDVTRYLNDEPVQARPTDRGYRLRKFVRRNRAAVAATAAVVLGMALGTVGMGVGMWRAQAAERVAVAERNAAREAQREAEHSAARARRESARATAVGDFMHGVLGRGHPEERAGAGDERAAMMVRLAGQQLTAALRDQPQEELRARIVLADTCRRLQLYDLAVEELGRAHALSAALPPPGGARSEQTLGLACDLVEAMHYLGRDAAARPLARSTLGAAREALGEGHPLAWKAANALALTVSTTTGRGGDEGVDEGFRIWSDLVARLRPVAEAQTAAHLGRYHLNLARWLRGRGRYAEAVSAIREAAAILGGDSVTPLAQRGRLALELSAALYEMGEMAEATALAEGSLPPQRLQYGDAHGDTRGLTQWTARMLFESGRHTEALPLFRTYIASTKAIYPNGTDGVASALYLTGLMELRFGNRAAASAAFEQAIAMHRRMAGRDDVNNERWWRVWALCCDDALAGDWHSATLRDHVWCALDDLVRDRVPAQLDPPAARARALRFRLLRWTADDAGEWIAEGDLDRLKALPEPASGMYLLGLDLPQAAGEPLRRATWLLAAPWELAAYPTAPLAETDARWRELTARQPLHRRPAGALAVHAGSRASPAENLAPLCWSGYAARASAVLPAGRYRFSASRAYGGVRVWVDGREVISAWGNYYDEGTQDAEVELAAGSHELRVEAHHGHDLHRLWLQVAPRGRAARLEAAALGGGVPQLDWEAHAAFRARGERPDDPAAAAHLGYALCRAGQFAEADTAFAAAARMDPSDQWRWYSRACLLAYAGNDQECRDVARAMVDRFSSSTDGGVLVRLALAWAVVPPAAQSASDSPAGPQQAAVEALLDRAGGGGRDWCALARGMLEYRAGRFERAAVHLGEALTAFPETIPEGPATAGLFLAMSYHRLGRPQEATAALERATALIESKLPIAGVDDLQATGGALNWLICQTALREAVATLRGPAGQPPGS